MHARFFVDKRSFLGNKILITDKELIHQITKVLRLKIGQQIILLDNSGFEYLVNLEKIGKQIEGDVLEKKNNENEPIKKIIICQSLLRGDKLEMVFKFCTNLGVNGFRPFISQRSIIKEINPNRIQRCQKIIKESAEQSGRAILPPLNKLMSFEEIIDFLKDQQGLKLIAWEEEKEKKLADFKKLIKENKEIYLMIGPAGGFSAAEVAQAKAHGFFSFSLGPLIFRSEIAGLITSAIILN